MRQVAGKRETKIELQIRFALCAFKGRQIVHLIIFYNI